MATLLQKAKTALRLKTDDENVIDEITGLVFSGIADLENTAGVEVGALSPASDFGDDIAGQQSLIIQAIITYVRMHFGEPDDYDRLARSYEMQKGNLKTAFRKEANHGSNSCY